MKSGKSKPQSYNKQKNNCWKSTTMNSSKGFSNVKRSRSVKCG